MVEMTATILARRMAARRKANAAGKKWAELSKEERQRFLKEASGGQPSAVEYRRAVRVLAKREAARAGKDWNTLPKEERRLLIGRMKARGNLANKK